MCKCVEGDGQDHTAPCCDKQIITLLYVIKGTAEDNPQAENNYIIPLL